MFTQKRKPVKNRQETAMGASEEFATKGDLKQFKEEIIHEFHNVAEGLTDQIKFLAEGHSGLAQRLDRVETRLEGVETRLDRTEAGQAGITKRLDQIDSRLDHVETGQLGIIQRLDRMEKENERQHLETRSLLKLSFSELDNRLSSLESQVKELQEWRKQVQDRLQFNPQFESQSSWVFRIPLMS